MKNIHIHGNDSWEIKTAFTIKENIKYGVALLPFNRDILYLHNKIKYLSIKVYKILILLVVSYGCEAVFHP
jgi:hypothetical protein